MPDSRVDWYANDVLLVVDNAQREMLLALAFQVEAEYKTRASVDTGFMRNSTYVQSAETSTFVPRTDTLTSRKTGRKQKRETISRPEVPKDDQEVIVGVGANYSIYREIEDGALHQALEAVAQQAPATIQEVGRVHFD